MHYQRNITVPKGAVLIDKKPFNKTPKQQHGLRPFVSKDVLMDRFERKAKSLGPATIIVSKEGMNPSIGNLALYKVDCNLLKNLNPRIGDYISFTSAVTPGLEVESGLIESVNASASCPVEADYRATDFRSPAQP